jgi:pimeloyl-ACP methyl ester carboxylesterase
VLDWGGTGPPLVFLAGLGNTAHVFDHFAHQFTDRFRVLGVTRRGYAVRWATPLERQRVPGPR